MTEDINIDEEIEEEARHSARWKWMMPWDGQKKEEESFDDLLQIF